FRTIRPQKSHKGQRVYSRRDVEKLLKVKDLLKNQGFTIAGAKKKLRDPDALAADVQASISVEESAAPAPLAVPLTIPSTVSPAEAPQADLAARERVRTALLEIRADIAAMLDELGSPPRRPKLPSLP